MRAWITNSVLGDSTIDFVKDFTARAPVIGGTLTPPFAMNIAFNVLTDGTRFYTDINTSALKITPTNVYYVTTSGNNANTGLTTALAVANVSAAIVKGNAAAAPYEIRVQNGTYDRNKDWTATPTQNCNIVADNGSVILSSEQALTYTNDGTNTYRSARSVVGNVCDANLPDANGDYERLVRVSATVSVQGQAGSWFTDGTNVWVHTTDNRDLSANPAGIKVYLNVNPPKINANITVYMEGINIEGFQNGALDLSNSASAQTTTFIAKNCSFKYSNNNNGLTCNGAAKVILDNCIAAKNYLDGFNYHAKNGTAPHVVEVSCVGRTNGASGSEANNASTIHDGSRIVRVNGNYFASEGRNIHDISTGTLSWNVACNSRASRALTDTGGINYMIGDTNSATMWLTNCISSGSNVDCKAETSATMYINNTLINATNVINGQIVRFVQEVK